MDDNLSRPNRRGYVNALGGHLDVLLRQIKSHSDAAQVECGFRRSTSTIERVKYDVAFVGEHAN
jgi:hypothetical protein